MINYSLQVQSLQVINFKGSYDMDLHVKWRLTQKAELTWIEGIL